MQTILEAAGFAGVTFTDVHEPVYYGSDVPAALDWVRGFACTREALDRLDPAAEARADGRLREMLAAHLSGDGVLVRLPGLDRHRSPQVNRGRDLQALADRQTLAARMASSSTCAFLARYPTSEVK